MIPDDILGSARALPPDEAIAAIRRRLDEGGEAGDLATSDVRALLEAHDRYREAALTSDSAAEREAIVWADRVVALEAERDRLRAVADAARAYVEGGEFSCDDVRTETREALTEALAALPVVKP